MGHVIWQAHTVDVTRYFNEYDLLGASYHPPAKLREGNIFTRVCLSVPRGSLYWTSWDPSPSFRTWDFMEPPASDIWWSKLEICSNLFNWGAPPTQKLKYGGYWSSTYAVGYSQCQRAVRILLECTVVAHNLKIELKLGLIAQDRAMIIC